MSHFSMFVPVISVTHLTPHVHLKEQLIITTVLTAEDITYTL